MRCQSLVIAGIFAAFAARVAVAAGPDFAREIRPILNEHCVECHGPDADRREADLRLDELHNAFQPRGERGAALVAGDLQQSLLWQRIAAVDPAERMPPADHAEQLNNQQIELLRAWIEAGAAWPRHWSYEAIQRPAVPHVATEWPINAIDAFTLKAMREHQLQPSAEASRSMLIRRVTLDLTGIPPTPGEVHAFVNDSAPGAYERLVDRLLASPRYGERMASMWLDAARYADTHGYHADSHRDMWLWRAWVINALNENKPFDEFTIEQLAGDLLPHATDAQRLATGFHRNTMLNAEEGALAEEYLAEYVADRVETTSTVWLAQTLHCARCHDHKYEPFTQLDYYRMFAYFNNVSEKGLGGRKGNAEPILWMPAPQQQRQLDELRLRTRDIDAQMKERRKVAVAHRTTWEAQLASNHHAAPPADVTWHVPLDERQKEFISGVNGQRVFNVQGDVQWVSTGKFGAAVLFNGSTQLSAAEELPDTELGFTLSLWVFPTTRDRMRLAGAGQEVGSIRRWQLLLHDGQLIAQVLFDGFETPWLVASEQKLVQRRWQNVVLTCASPTSGSPVQIYLDGQPITPRDAEQPQTLSQLEAQPFHVGASKEEGFRGLIDDVRYYSRPVSSTEAGLLAGGDPIGELLRVPPDQRSRQHAAQLLNHYLEHFDSEYQSLKAAHQDLDRRMRDIMVTIPTTMVMDEQRPPRKTHVLQRGDYQSTGEEVTPGTPAVLPPLLPDAPPNRLTLARWLVDAQNPLTARVAVNRIWQLHFGTGLVASSDDFGLRGELPTHPQLLDWLAAEFIDSNWDVKRLQRMMVLSATYRQTSECREERRQADPENRWLSRCSRQRLSAEQIRDSALAASGLLQEHVGGPSVYPYQPPGLWEELAYNQDQYTAQRYLQSHGADLYRRSVYTFWKRTSPPPAMSLFDAPNRERCVVRRTRSSTPLQSLVLMNDPTYLEACRKIAERVLHESNGEFEQQLRQCFHLLMARDPQPRETALLQTVYQTALQKYSADETAAESLLSVGESPRDETLPIAQVAAWTIVAQVLLNTEEAITRP